MSIGQEIVRKGEALRDLIRAERSLTDIIGRGIDVDGINFSSHLVEPRKLIVALIPLVKRELPSWAVELAVRTADVQRGFVVWEENT